MKPAFHKLFQNQLVRVIASRPAQRLTKRLSIFFRAPAEMLVYPRSLDYRGVLLSPHDAGDVVILDEFEAGAYPLSMIPFEPDHIVDIGAHIGMFSILATIRFPKASLYAIEPSSRNFAILNTNLSRNCKVYESLNAAVSSESGVETFDFHSSCDGRLGGSSNETVGTAVAVCDIAGLLTPFLGGKLLIKMDIEGAEKLAIPRMLEGMHPIENDTAVFFETHFGEQNWQSAKEEFEKLGFIVSILRRNEQCVDALAIKCVSGNSN